ncbi:MAG: hypothetical protein ACD_79C01356G0005 [uncultured bacterium]|nr:MAG: hypothetical protein ACD_79C01356G0005 [uncultured bacterium]
MNSSNTYFKNISLELNITPHQVEATKNLLDNDATVPFIARYRKEATKGLDEVQITYIRDRFIQLEELDKRKASILKSLEERSLLTQELQSKFLNAESLTLLEDLYLPYKPKKRTKASIAREKGLEPLAIMLLKQKEFDIEKTAQTFINSENGLDTASALQGARDIIAETISEDLKARENLRELYYHKGVLYSTVIKDKEEEASKYRDYFKWEEPVKTISSHRFLAIMRGVNEEFLSFDISPPENLAIKILEDLFIATPNNNIAEQIKLSIKDSYKRLLSKSMENEIKTVLKDKADEDAIKVFAENARQLLLAAPLGQQKVLAIDPGFRTGCKLVCLDEQGALLCNHTIYPHEPVSKTFEAEKTVVALCNKFDIKFIAVGNGTAGRETESFLKKIPLKDITIIMVNESGASIYSASEAAREEFPGHDVTVRGAISIGRRLMDPLAELVKIDPKSIGVGQYQHDVNQKLLKDKLDDTVSSCVNLVGVEVNTSSKQLLAYVSGLNSRLAENIILHRNENGKFNSRKDLKKVKGMGPKAFEQSAGFLRIRNSQNPLDSSAVHPESYHIVEAMANDMGKSVAEIINNTDLRKNINLKKYVSEKIGLPTLNDIMEELEKPGRDPRKTFEVFSFSNDANKIEDLKPGMKLPGIVTNITNFGAFVDIGVHQDGLVHISQLSDKYIKDPNEVVKLSQNVMVTVVNIDLPRKRIALSMKAKPTIQEMK